MSKKTAYPIPLPLSNSERLLLHEKVLIAMLDTVESFLPMYTDLVLKVILDPDKIRREVGDLRRDHPTMTRNLET
jgi:hypothetical protein